MSHKPAAFARTLLPFLAILSCGVPLQAQESTVLERAYYLHHAEGELDAALKLYEKAAADPALSDSQRDTARREADICREDLVTSDFARVMPENPLAYIELNRPGTHLQTLLGGLDLLQSRQAPGQIGVSPALLQAVLGVRGAAVAVTGIDVVHGEPTGVAVFHPGDVEVIRGLLASALPVQARALDPIEGCPVYDIEGKVRLAITSRLVIVSPQTAEIEGVIRRLRHPDTPSLASNDVLRETLAERGDSLLYFVVNAEPIMPMVAPMLAMQASRSQVAAIANALLDIRSLRTLAGRVDVGGDELSVSLGIELNHGHRNLVYNLLRLPALDRSVLDHVPQGCAGFLALSLNEPASRFRQASSGEQDPIVTAMDFGREVFGNIVSMALFVMPEAGDANAAHGQIPSAGLVLTVNDPGKSEALWTQILGIASMASGGMMEGATAQIEGRDVRSFRMPEGITIHVCRSDAELVIGTTRQAIADCIRARQSGASVKDDDVFARALSLATDHCTLASAVQPSRMMTIARRHAPDGDRHQIDMVSEVLTGTVISAMVNHSGEQLNVSAKVQHLPRVGNLVRQMVQERGFDRLGTRATEFARADSMIRAVEQPDLMDQFEHAVRTNDRGGAQRVGEQMTRTWSNNAQQLNNAAWTMLTEEPFAEHFDALALRLSERSNELTQYGNWAYLDTLALAMFRTGARGEAIDLEQKAIQLSPPEQRQSLEEALARFRGE